VLFRSVTVNEHDEAATFRAMVEQAKEVIVVADSSKLGVISPALVCTTERIKILVTDTGATDEAAAGFLERGIQVLKV